MRVLYVITQSSWGGAQKYVYFLASHLAEIKGTEVIVAGGKESEGELAKQLARDHIKFTAVKNLVRSINPIKDLMAVWELKKLIETERPDVIHLNSSKAGAVGSLAARLSRHRAKVVYTVHGWVFNENINPAAKLAYYLIEKSTSGLKDIFICISDADRRAGLAKKIAPAEKIIRIYNGIDLPADYFLSKPAARKKLSITDEDEKSITIGCIANFYPTKGLNFLIDAVKIIILNNRLPLRAVIIGDGELKTQLEKQISDIGLGDKVILAGAIPSADKYLKAFDIAVMPSVKEGVPYFLLEALSAGVPIIATKVGGIPEIIADNATGLLCNPQNARELADKIMLLAENRDLRSRFGQAGLERVKRDFNEDKMMRETLAAYGD